MNLVFSPILAFAATPPDGGLLNSIGVSAGNGGHGVTLSVPMQIALGLTLLTILPAAVMCITPFLRIIVVLHFLRQLWGRRARPPIRFCWASRCSSPC
jgi:flagellar biosynthetic protein FliP